MRIICENKEEYNIVVDCLINVYDFTNIKVTSYCNDESLTIEIPYSIIANR